MRMRGSQIACNNPAWSLRTFSFVQVDMHSCLNDWTAQNCVSVIEKHDTIIYALSHSVCLDKGGFVGSSHPPLTWHWPKRWTKRQLAENAKPRTQQSFCCNQRHYILLELLAQAERMLGVASIARAWQVSHASPRTHDQQHQARENHMKRMIQRTKWRWPAILLLSFISSSCYIPTNWWPRGVAILLSRSPVGGTWSPPLSMGWPSCRWSLAAINHGIISSSINPWSNHVDKTTGWSFLYLFWSKNLTVRSVSLLWLCPGNQSWFVIAMLEYLQKSSKNSS